MRRYACCVLVAVLALAAAPLAAGTARVSSQRETGLEQGILREVNRVRTDYGFRPLVLSRALQASSAFQSRVLLAQGVFDHDTAAGGSFGERLRRFYPVGDAQAWGVGENLLWSTAGINASAAVKLWLASPVHRKVMLDPSWREFGVGAYGAPSAPGVYAAAGAVVVVTMDFGSRTASSRSTSSVTRR